MQLNFWGAAGTVTGSKYLVTTGSRRVLVDCGLFQGLKELRLRNRTPFPVEPASIDAVVLTHAHLDHTGYLPLLVRNGFRGPVYCTEATRHLSEILLPDSGHLQEEEAAFANREGYSRHRPALPLYTRDDAVQSLERFAPIPYEEEVELGGGVSVRLHPAGHILGAATVRLRAEGTSVLFSGDLGRPNDPILRPPAPAESADYLVVESTYGDRRHAAVDPAESLAEVVTRTAARGGSVVIPAFAVGRTQTLLYLVRHLKEEGRIPDLPVFLDSPMAGAATRVFREHGAAESLLDQAEVDAVCDAAKVVETVQESKRIDRGAFPRIIISASGMATGGRVLHHLKVFAPDPRNTILFTGYQALGTRGGDMVRGAEEVKIHGAYVPVRAEVASLDNVSGHADYAEILEWLRTVPAAPRRTFITHGEPAAADALRRRIEEELSWSCRIPEHGEQAEL
jgi:metallo-beta-lactamase family protein